MKAHSVVAGWVSWLRWSLCWHTEVATRSLRQNGERVGLYRRELS